LVKNELVYSRSGRKSGMPIGGTILTTEPSFALLKSNVKMSSKYIR